MSALRVFLAHPRSMPAEGIEAAAQVIRAHLAADTEVIPGRDDFEQVFRNYGSVKRWAASVAQRYDGVVVVPVDGLGAVGSATAEIIEAALLQERHVRVLYHDGTLLPCFSVEKRSGKPRDGWHVEVCP